jgi:hypothetical protein
MEKSTFQEEKKVLQILSQFSIPITGQIPIWVIGF